MYYRHFRLTGPPFEALAGPEALYLSRAHRESLAALEWGLLHEPSGFTTLTGETGTGKTTLVSSILARNFAQLRAAYVINPKLSFEDILRVILGQFGIPCAEPGKLDRIEALVGFLGARMPNERLAIIVDEAQDLSDDSLEELRLLSNYGQRIGKYLQLVLVGQPELGLRLKSPSLRQFNQRVAARSVLSRLSFAEAHEYVGYRLRARDGRSRDIFDSDALDYLLRHSAGIPRQINVLCHNAMLLAYSAGAPLVDLKAARAAVADHGESLLGAWTLTIPSRGLQPIYVGVAALGLLLFAGYGYRAVPTQPPRISADASAAVSMQAARSIGERSINVARNVARGSKVSFKAAVNTVTKQAVATAAVVAAPPIKRPTADANAENRSSGTLRSSPVSIATAEDPQPENPKVRQSDIADLVLPAALPAQPAIKNQDSQNEKSQSEETREVGKVQQSVHASTPSVAQEADHKRSILVKYGDTLEKLAQRYLGSRYALNEIIDDNPQIMDINRIYPGQKVYLSGSEPTSPAAVRASRVASQPSNSFADNASHIDDSNGPDSARAVKTDSR
jgi:type II secretory pathway predicted ATPase ExeA